MEIVLGKIIDIKEDGGVLIGACFPSIDKALLRQYSDVEVAFCDGRHISPQQRRKTYALIHEISVWMGEHDEIAKKAMKLEFKLNRMQGLQRKLFSLSDVDMTTAREFITFLIDFILENDIPTKQPLTSLCDDISKYVYSCLMTKHCAVCGLTADLHHHDEKIGVGRDRDKILQIGMGVLPLCREHHTLAHTMGKQEFLDKFHLQTVGLTKEIGKKYGLTKKNLGD